MLVEVVGCSHHGTSIALRERLAFTAERTREALDRWRRAFPGVEAVGERHGLFGLVAGLDVGRPQGIGAEGCPQDEGKDATRHPSPKELYPSRRFPP